MSTYTPSFRILTNYAGLVLTSGVTLTGLTRATGYRDTSLAEGNRALSFRSTTTTGGTCGYFHNGGASHEYDHFAIIRADTLQSQTLSGANVYLATRNGNVYSGVQLLDLSASGLVGINSQDYVIGRDLTCSGFGVTFVPSGSTAMQFNGLYGSNAFYFGTEPDFDSQVIDFDSETQFKPLRGDQYFGVDARIVLEFSNVSFDKVEEFRALPFLLEQPFLCYDPEGYIWSHKLEHVVLESYRLEQTDSEGFDIRLQLLRLKQWRF